MRVVCEPCSLVLVAKMLLVKGVHSVQVVAVAVDQVLLIGGNGMSFKGVNHGKSP